MSQFDVCPSVQIGVHIWGVFESNITFQFNLILPDARYVQPISALLAEFVE